MELRGIVSFMFLLSFTFSIHCLPNKVHSVLLAVTQNILKMLHISAGLFYVAYDEVFSVLFHCLFALKLHCLSTCCVKQCLIPYKIFLFWLIYFSV